MSLADRLRRKRLAQLSMIQVATPCPVRWEEMIGDEKVRYCAACRLSVFDLSAMDVEETADRIAEHDGSLCVRFYRRPDGTILTQDCPVGIQAAKQKRWAKVRDRAIGLGVAGALTALMLPTQGAVARPSAIQASLVSACKTGNVQQIRGLLEAGARMGVGPDTSGTTGVTPLMFAARCGQVEAVRFLLAQGAKVNAKDSEGLTPLQWARLGSHRRVIALLRKAGATE
jgi:hypothetical protein